MEAEGYWKRWSFAAVLVGIYLLASSLTWLSEQWISTRTLDQEGTTRVTLHHFHQPEEWGISPRILPVFLARVTQHKPGLFASKWLYGGILGSYLLLMLLVFLRLTRTSTEKTLQPGHSGLVSTGNSQQEDISVWSWIVETVSKVPSWRRLSVEGLDLAIILVALPLAYSLRFNSPTAFLEDAYWHQFGITFLILGSIRLLLRPIFHLQRMVWRYTGLLELRRLIIASTVGTLSAVTVLVFITRLQGVPRSVLIMEWGIYLFLAAGARISSRISREMWLEGKEWTKPVQRKPVIIIGAGSAGGTLVRELMQNPEFEERAVAFVDDDPGKQNREILGIPIFTPIESLSETMARFDTRLVYLALPSATSAQMRRVVRICEKAEAESRTLPALSAILHNGAILPQLRPIQLEDLLGREPVNIDTEQITEWLRGKRILVTGAAGSIGSELCRQLLGAGVGHLTLLDQSELQLYSLQDELKTRLAQIPHHCLIGSVTDQIFVADVLREECPQVIFHAAAYKHVHLMEENPRAALITNVLGTAVMGREALTAGVEHFVLISSDKAVHPTSVMGATKRMAEQVCLGLNSQKGTMFHVVRFGNVIGSSGSVVPLFERQLTAGGPLTVTHHEVTRYFMTIPEAARLILQTVLMGRGGEIFLLEMGEPVKILDLAEQMILLAGREPYAEIPIEFVGLRQGEKLHEELWSTSEQTDQTAHQKILKVASSVKTEEPAKLLAKADALLSLPTISLGSAIVKLANERVAGREQAC